MAVAGGGREVVPPIDLFLAEFHTVGSGVLLDPRDPACTRDRGDAVALGEEPCQCDLCRGGSDLGGDRLDLGDDAQVALEVLNDEAWVGLRPVVVGDVVQRADLAGESRRIFLGAGVACSPISASFTGRGWWRPEPPRPASSWRPIRPTA